MNSRNLITFVAVVLMLISGVSVFTKSIYAKEVCTDVYGGGEVCKTVDGNPLIKINKEIFNPKLNTFVDKLPLDNRTFRLDEVVKFRLTITNNGDQDLKNVVVIDQLPESVKYKSYSSADAIGKPEVDGRNIRFNVGDLKTGTTKVLLIYTTYGNNTILPEGDDVCVTNFSSVIAYSGETRVTDSDTVNYCYTLEGKVLGSVVIARELVEPKVLPETGPEVGLALSGGLAVLGLAIKRIFK